MERENGKILGRLPKIRPPILSRPGHNGSIQRVPVPVSGEATDLSR